MKPMRNIITLSLVILLLCGGFYFVTVYEPKTEVNQNPTSFQTVTIFTPEKDTITALHMQNEEESYTISKAEDGSWVINNNPSIKANQSRIESLLYEYASITGKELLEENAQDLAQYGLESPARSATITFADGSTQTILVGDETIDGSVCYMMVQGETKVYTKSSSGCDSMLPSLQKLLQTDIYNMTAEELGNFTMNRQGTPEVRLVREKVGESEEGQASYEWKMKAPLVKEANIYNIEDILENLLSQTAIRVIPDGSQNGDYGFDEPKATYSIVNLDGSITHTVTVGGMAEDGTYLRLAGDSAVYVVKTETLDFLQKSYLDFVDKLIHVENITDIKSITLAGKGKSYEMELSEAEKRYQINGKEIKEQAFKTVYQALSGLMLDDFTFDATGSAAPDYTITYIKHDGSQTTIQCISYNDRNYVVKVNGEGNFLIRKKQMDAVLTVLDKTIA
ncbi:MAG: DUF4340 domain-containing protein [Clostridia bacterium]|nr:DUF4340 domain-containing protein [Clostridia bacterium]